MSDTEKYLTLGFSYVVIALLWWVLRQKEKRQDNHQ
ncbi:hypothetical protein EVA_08273 [gut metagenome]|uniref:Uncharacterized protein n=1 Tax=gut metagenome TaxID=749906 RepID=J9G8Q2_9ZZZZ